MFVLSVEVVGKNVWYAVLFLAFFGMHLFVVSPLFLMVKAAKFHSTWRYSEAQLACCYST